MKHEKNLKNSLKKSFFVPLGLFLSLLVFFGLLSFFQPWEERSSNILHLGNPMNYSAALEKLKTIDQQHLLSYWELLNSDEKANLLAQVEALDVHAFTQQKEVLKVNASQAHTALEPITDYTNSGNVQDREVGLRLIAEGKVGCMLMAGGQGTRLGLEGPKGMCSVSVIKDKSLFQLFAEKVLAAGKQAGRPLTLAIMTSPLNHDATYDFFLQNNFFGLKPEQLFLFPQSMLPFLNQDGQLFLENPSKIAEGPDGNGLALKHFVGKGIWKKWNDLGINYVNYILVDNPLADPYDAELIGFHHRQQAEVTVKGTSRRHAQEKVGLLVKEDAALRVVEYSEFPEEERVALSEDGGLKHRCANISLFCFSMDFIARSATKYQEMPLHLALKPANALDASNTVQKINAGKFETFIFDLLPLSKRTSVLLYPREECFAPLKNLTGDNTVADVKRALQEYDAKVFVQVFGHKPPEHPFELAQEYHYPTPELLQRGKKSTMSKDFYIE
jgi:UDP-N-acetylglucosamine/UDP-N-acetylgalactosamine diphosphorylase